MTSEQRVPLTFEEYLGAALAHAVLAEIAGRGQGALQRQLERIRKGAQTNWDQVTATTFMQTYLFCIGSIQKRYERRMRESDEGSYWSRQLKLFRDGEPERIAADEVLIRAEWSKRKEDLNPKMVNAVIHTARHLCEISWPVFKKRYLHLPDDPATKVVCDWQPSLDALKHLELVGDAIAPYLLRNLYGGAFFKPDLHIIAIARHYFADQSEPLTAMAAASEMH